jgi:hypothetical protein
MTRPKLRIFYGPQEQSAAVADGPADAVNNRVTVPLNDVLPLLAEAYRNRRLWLSDFAADEIAISSDLYDVLLAYENLHRPSA